MNDDLADAGPAPAEPQHPLVSSDTTACCRTELSKDGYKSAHREACCDLAISWIKEINGGDVNIANACTPWGPPVPPAMKPRLMMS